MPKIYDFKFSYSLKKIDGKKLNDLNDNMHKET